MNSFQEVLAKIKRRSVKETIELYKAFEPVSDEVKFILHLAELEADRLSLSDQPIEEAIKYWKIGAIKYRMAELAYGYTDTDSVKAGDLKCL